LGKKLYSPAGSPCNPAPQARHSACHTMGNLKKKRRLKMNKHKRSKRLRANRHKKRVWGN